MNATVDSIEIRSSGSWGGGDLEEKQAASRRGSRKRRSLESILLDPVRAKLCSASDRDDFRLAEKKEGLKTIEMQKGGRD
jgi:hypothetical protein